MEARINQMLQLITKKLAVQVQSAVDEHQRSELQSSGSGPTKLSDLPRPIFHDILLRVTRDLLVRENQKFQNKTHVLMWGLYTCWLTACTYGLWVLQQRREAKAKATAAKSNAANATNANATTANTSTAAAAAATAPGSGGPKPTALRVTSVEDVTSAIAKSK